MCQGRLRVRVQVTLRRSAYLVLPVFEILWAHSAVPVAVEEGVGIAFNLIPVDGDIAVVCCDGGFDGDGDVKLVLAAALGYNLVDKESAFLGARQA